jgi:photosystem II stability/assembly factor-like uncharacterized protein
MTLVLVSFVGLLVAISPGRLTAQPPRGDSAVTGVGGWTVALARPIPRKYEDISFPSAKHGWVTTAMGDILHTADGGASWSVQASGLGVVRSVDFLDEKIGFAGTLEGRLHTTSNGGTTWTDITASLPHAAKGFCGITHVGREVHIVGRYYGGATDYFYSPDAGKSWQYADLAEHAQGLVDVSFVSKSVGFIGGMAKSAAPNQGVATILKTTDGGKTWRSVFVHDGGRGYVWKLWPISPKLIYAALQSQDGTYRIAKTTDGGDHWATLIVATGQPQGFGVQGIGFLDANRGWVGGFFRGMWATEDGGKTWTSVPTPDATINRYEKIGRTMFTAGTRGILRFDDVDKGKR